MAKTIKTSKTVSGTVPKKHYRFLNEAIIFLFSFIVFGNSIPNGYNLDDEIVTRNHRLTSKGISAIPEIFASPYYQDASGYSYEYRPMVLVSFAVEHQFFGDDPQVGHFFNILLYALACLVLFKTLLLLFKGYSPFLSVVVTLFFIAHPAHTEVVCSIKNRDEILGLLFSLLAFWTALTAVHARRFWLVLLMLLLFTCALLSKVTVVSFILIIPLGLVLFSEVGIGWLLIFTLALATPACIFINIGGGIQRIAILTASIIAVLVIYILAKSDLSFISVRSKVTGNFKGIALLNSENPSDSFSDIRANVLPGKKIWSLFPILITLFLAVAYVFSIWAGYSLLAFIPILILVALALAGEDQISWWASVMISICFTACIAVMAISGVIGTNDEWFRELFSLYLGYQLFFGKKGLFIPTLLCFAITNYLIITPAHNHNWTGLSALLMILLTFRYVRIGMVFIALGSNVAQAWQGEASLLGLLNLAASMMVILSIHFHRGRTIVAPTLAVILSIVFYAYQVQQVSAMPLQSAVIVVDRQMTPPTISKPQNRPLTYMENCIDRNTPLNIRTGTSLEILFLYLHKVVLPYPMSFYYGYKFIYPQKISNVLPIVALLIYILLFALALALLRRQPPLAFGIFTYLVSVIVFSDYVQPVPGMLADRFLLIPSLGWVITLVFIIKIAFRISRSGITDWASIPAADRYTFILILLLYSAISFSRNLDWKDDLTLFRHDISYVDQSAQAHNLLALHIMQHTELEQDIAQRTALEREALIHFKRAQEIYPHFFNIAYDIGRVYTLLNMQDSAIAAFKYSLTLDTLLSDDYLSLSSLLMTQSRYAEAIPYLESVIRLTPDEYVGYEKQSFSYFQIHHLDQSIQVNLRAISHIPGIPEPYINIARTYMAENQSDSVKIYLDKANRISPNNPEVQQLLRQINK